MPTIDEAIERACAAYAAHVGETIFEDGMRAALSAFLADVPVSEAIQDAGACCGGVEMGSEEEPIIYPGRIFKAMSAKLAEEIQ